MKRQSIFVWIVVMTAGTSVYSADWQVDWIGGENIPVLWSWSIYPSPLHFPPSSHPPGTVPFSGPTGVFSNDCYAEAGLGGTPTITIDPNEKTIELWFQPPAPNDCTPHYKPVSGLNGWFGPLVEGNWLFYSNQIPSPYGSFHINFHVDYPLSSPCKYGLLGDWNGDCYVDFGDFSIIAAGWDVYGGTDMNDLAGFVQYWLDCANPYDPSCSNFGEAMPDFPDDGAVIPGTNLGDDIYTTLEFLPGATAVKHTGYFSEDYAEVSGRVEDANLGQPPFPTSFPYRYYVGLYAVPPATESLVRGTKYYWTVDAEDALGNTFPGEIWEFTILDFKATLPNPPNEATLVETDVLLSWQPGFYWYVHDVYIDTSYEAVRDARYYFDNQPPEFLATISEPNIAVTSLELNTTYYWRVDEVWGRLPPPGAPTYYIGDVWSFTTIPGSAEPNFPADGAVIPGSQYIYNIYTRLDFFPGATAVEHTGYFNEDCHQDANLGPPPFAEEPGYEYRYYVGLPPGGVPGDPYSDGLVRGTKYYWTVDAEDAIGNTFPGEIWEFTILDFKASFPNPPNEATLVETDVLLSWLPGYGVSTSFRYYVYFGTDFNDVNNAEYRLYHPEPPGFLASVSEPNIAVTSLELNTTYYWKVDETLYFPIPMPGYIYYYKGDVWCFTTTPSALNNNGFINFIDYAIPSNYSQKTGPSLPADSHKDDVVDYKDLRILIPE